MRLQTLLLLACLPAFVTGCMGGGDNTGTPDESGSLNNETGGGNETMYEEVVNATVTLDPQSSNVLPGSNNSVVMPVTLNETYASVVVNVTIVSGTSVGLRATGLGECEMTFGAPASPGRTYSNDCGAVPPGSYNLTFSQTSGSTTLQVAVLGAV